MTVEWSRLDLGDQYVLLYRDGHFNSHNQHPSFKNRVDLQDRQMKDGDVSLILKNVTINDAGTYECRVKPETNRRKRANLSGDPISIIYLHVDPPGQTGGATEDGSVGLIVGLTVFVVLLVAAVVVFLVYIIHKQNSQDSHHPPAEAKTEMSESFLNSESPAAEQRDRYDLEANNCHQHPTMIPDVTLTPNPPGCHIVKFADDTAVVGCITNNDETGYRKEVELLEDWCKQNNLCLNEKKTKEMIVDFRRGRHAHTPLHFG
ncbi:uncharacterized protein LOC102307756 [Haplochromis burtoni]|uniref:uncharacterized protein LOC102307756 n=1 Tax=Haplochromis burtoni TaxID=8153 RepID=UPI001C2CEF3F|nr:uncharacterized protein LOC102307756 [Haplochromis burtoni]